MRKFGVLLAPTLVACALLTTGCAGDSDSKGSSSGVTSQSTKSIPDQDPRNGWVVVDKDDSGWHMDQKCIHGDLVTRSEVYGGYDITTHVNATACIPKQ